MALIACSECGNEISDKAASCVRCGNPISPQLLDQPAAGSADAVKSGRQRSRARADGGKAIAFVGLPIALVVGMATTAAIGWGVAFAVMVLAVVVAYGG